MTGLITAILPYLIFAIICTGIGIWLYLKYKKDLEWDKDRHACLTSIKEEVVVNKFGQGTYVYHYTAKIKYKGYEKMVNFDSSRYFKIGTYLEYDIDKGSFVLIDDGKEMKIRRPWCLLSFLVGYIPLIISCIIHGLNQIEKTIYIAPTLFVLTALGIMFFIAIKDLWKYKEYLKKKAAGVLIPIEVEVYDIRIERHHSKKHSYDVFYPLVKYVDHEGTHRVSFVSTGAKFEYDVGDKLTMQYDRLTHEAYPMNHAEKTIKFILGLLAVTFAFLGCLIIIALDLTDVI